MKIYIATKLDNMERHQQLSHALKIGGVTLTYDWTIHGSVKSTSVGRIRTVAMAEAKGVEDSDVVIVILQGGRGTHTELGMAIGFNKPVILYAEPSLADRVFEPTGETCAFYHHPSVHKVSAEWGLCFVTIFDMVKKFVECRHRSTRTMAVGNVCTTCGVIDSRDAHAG